jgi:hypothetical protein
MSDIITHAPATGIYRMAEDGSVSYHRFDYKRQDIESENEAFFLRISGPGDYRYEGRRSWAPAAAPPWR